MKLMGTVSFRDEDGTWYVEATDEQGRARSWNMDKRYAMQMAPEEASFVMEDAFRNQGRESVKYVADLALP